jgi:hypothetical protein
MTTITKTELMTLATSNNPAERKRALDLYLAWVKAAPKLPYKDRLTATERMLLVQIFNSKKP